MDETEIRNIDWREYVYWLERVYGSDYPQVSVNALPDTLSWRDELAFTKPYVELYYRHPAYSEYPVVGVTWLQASDYCVWRTDRVNEYILIREGILKVNPNQVNEDNFNLDTYLKGQYEGLVKDEMIDLNPNNEYRKVRIEDGILLPRYRLPTESEWEFAAIGLIGNTIDERILDRRIYPWNGHWVRNKDDNWQGEMMANIMRAKGDNMGVASRLNDAADITAPVRSYWPNDYGLYQMAGNVSEWVMDVYRPLTLEDGNEFRSFRGNVYETYAKDADGFNLEKDSLGKMQMRPVDIKNPEDELEKRRNYKKSQNIDFLDGEFSSSVYYDDPGMAEPAKANRLMYETSKYSLQSNRTRVYKGGNWKDRVFWMAPGTRRFLDEDQDQDNLGFRCAMHRVGKPTTWE
jgi:gliding motility-associated lipoprotein GldJ